MNGGGRPEEIFRDDKDRQGFLTTLGEACAKKGKVESNCPCGGTVSLAEPKERVHFRSKVEAMEQSADRQRDFDAFVVSAKGETSTKSFQDWAGGEQGAIVLADVVGSTAKTGSPLIRPWGTFSPGGGEGRMRR